MYSKVCMFWLLIIIIIFFSGCSFKSDTILKNNTYTVQWYYGDTIILITPTTKVWGFTSFFSTNGITAAEYNQQLIQEWKNNCTLINGTYFGLLSGWFQPAWTITLYLGLHNKQIIPSTIDPSLDQNLKTLVQYNSINNTVVFDKDNNIIRWIQFYAWPMIITNNTINPNLSTNTSHRNGKYPRTFLVQDYHNKTILGITTKKVSLTELGEKLKELFPSEKTSVINLDGWPSTTLYNEYMSFNITDEKLPLWFSICE